MVSNSALLTYLGVGLCLTATVLGFPVIPTVSNSHGVAISNNNQSEMTSNSHDVSASHGRSEKRGGDTAWTGETTAFTLTMQDVEEERDMQTDDSDAESDNESGVLTQGQGCMMMLAYTMTQTNVTFRFMCSRMAREDQMDSVEAYCTELYQSAIAVSPLPRLQNGILDLQKKTVYTLLLSAYNVTFQYAHILETISTTMQCETCDVTAHCADVSSKAPEHVRRYCEVRNLLVKFHSLLNCMGQMMLKLHGSLPTLHAVSFPSHQDPTAQIDFDFSALAMAATQLAEVKNLMEQDVMAEL